jgi:ABC-2 type transport system ATP-binding protein
MTVQPGRASGDDVGSATAVASIEVDRLSKWYGDVVAVSEVSFKVWPGVTALLGPNGAGKSSILKVIAGLLKPSTGTVRVFGESVRGNESIYRRMALVPEHEGVYPFLTGREYVELNATLQHLPDVAGAAQRALEIVELVPDADRAVGGYSKGMRQRIKIAGALVHDPDLLILDEPLTGTDPVQRLHMIELFRRLGEEGKTLFVSSHVLHEVERVGDRILVIVDGKLAAEGDYRAIREQIDEHARMVRVRSAEPRRLATLLIDAGSIQAVRFEPGDGAIVLETEDVRNLYRLIPRIASSHDIRLFEITALDDSLASVFTYVTER